MLAGLLARVAPPAASTPTRQVGMHELSEESLHLDGVPRLSMPEVSSSGREAASASADDVAVHPDVHRQFEPLAKLGAGGYAVVISVRERHSGRLLVLKKIIDA